MLFPEKYLIYKDHFKLADFEIIYSVLESSENNKAILVLTVTIANLFLTNLPLTDCQTVFCILLVVS